MKWIRLPVVMLFYLSISISLNAQPAGPSVVASGGSSTEGKNLVLEWTLGELAVRSIATSQGMFTEGFHQPVLTVEEIALPNPTRAKAPLELTVAPNPVHSTLNIRLHSEIEGKVVISLFDPQGRRLRSFTTNPSGSDLEWDMSNYPAALYHLSVRTERGELLKSFKVTKID